MLHKCFFMIVDDCNTGKIDFKKFHFSGWGLKTVQQFIPDPPPPFKQAYGQIG